ncbi:MAG TPA: hypothetical protein DCG85_02480, partial [Lachnospiraceae bacterium]|nr:hypothetical protein [Lachnospiraceae bacterium]
MHNNYNSHNKKRKNKKGIMRMIQRRIVPFMMSLFIAATTILGSGTSLVDVFAYGDPSGITINNYRLLIEQGGSWVEVTPGMEVPNGANVRFAFDWDVSNLSDAVVGDEGVSIELKPIAGISIGNVDKTVYYSGSGSVPMGVYWVTTNSDGNSVFHLNIDQDFYNTNSERSGDARLEGNINAASDSDEETVSTDIKFLDKTIPNVIVNFGAKSNTLNVSKSGGSYDRTTGLQNFTVNLSVTGNSTESVRDISLTDTLGAYLSNVQGGFTLDGGANYADLDSLAAALKDKSNNPNSMDVNTSHTITYAVKIDTAAASAPDANFWISSNGTGVNNGENLFTANYTHKGNPYSSSAKAAVNLQKPSVNKSGADAGESIKWTIEINTGDFASLSDVNVSSLTDFVTNSKNGSQDTSFYSDPACTSLINLTDISKYTASSDGKRYTITYYSKKLDGETKPVKYTNNVDKIRIGDTDYKTGATVTTTGDSISKKYTEVTGDKIKWESEIEIPEDTNNSYGWGGITIDDKTDFWGIGKHVIPDGSSLEIVGDNGTSLKTLTLSDEDIMEWVDSYIGYFAFLNSNNTGYHLEIGNKVLNVWRDAGIKKITLKYETQIKDYSSAGLIYRNEAVLSYTDSNENNFESKSQAEYKNDAIDMIIKDGTVGEDNRVKYRIVLDLKQFAGEFTTDKDIVITDTLPKELSYDSPVTPDSGHIRITDGSSDGVNNIYYVSDTPVTSPADLIALNTTITVDDSGDNDVITFRLSGTDAAQKQKIAEALNKAKTDEDILYIEFYAKVKDPAEFAKNKDSVKVTNVVTGKFGTTDIGEHRAENTITPKSLVSKQQTYTQVTAPYIHYTIDVNPDGADVNKLPSPEGDFYNAFDNLGTALMLMEEVGDKFIVKYEEGGTWNDLTYVPWSGVSSLTGRQWSYTYNPKAGVNAITFKLPDKLHLKIYYRAYLDSASIPYDSDGKQKLTFETAGNTFAIEGSSSDNTKKQIDSNNHIISSLVEGNGATGNINILKFYIDENGNAQGLAGSTFKIYGAKWDGSKFVKDDTDIFKDTNGVSEFKMSNDDEENVLTVKGLKLDYVYALVEVGAKSGFAVNTDPYFFALKGKNYSDSQARYSNQSLKQLYENGYFSQFSNSGAYIRYENRKQATTSVKITKAVTGKPAGLDWDDIMKSLTFKVYRKLSGSLEPAEVIAVITGDTGFTYTEDTSGNRVYSYVLTGVAIDDSGAVPKAYEYYVTEENKAIEGYTLSGTKVKVNSGTLKTDTVSDTFVADAAISEYVVAYDNTYTRDSGKLSLKKSVVNSDIDRLTDEELKKIEFIITPSVNSTGSSTKVSLADATRTGSGSTGDPYVYTFDFANVPTGTYKVTENNMLFASHPLSITYDLMVDGTLKESGSYALAPTASNTKIITSGALVEKGKDTVLNITDKYTRETSRLNLNKTISGLEEKDDIKAVMNALTFTCSPAFDASATGTGYTASKTVIMFTPDADPVNGTFTATSTINGSSNVYKSGTYKLVKTPSGDLSLNLPFDVFSGRTYSITESVTNPLSGKKGLKISYVVTREGIKTGEEGNVAKTSGDKGTALSADEEVTVSFSNRYSDLKKPGLRLRKKFSHTGGGVFDWDTIKGSITYTVYKKGSPDTVARYKDGNTYKYLSDIPASSFSAAGSGIYESALYELEEAGEYYVVENVTGDEFTKTDASGTYIYKLASSMPVKFTVTGESGHGLVSGETTTPAEAVNSGTKYTSGSFEVKQESSIGADDQSVATFTMSNDYERKTGKLKLTKTIVDELGGTGISRLTKEQMKNITFTITPKNYSGTAIVKTMADLYGASYSGTDPVDPTGSGTSYSLTINDLPYGEYTVTETNYNEPTGTRTFTSLVTINSGGGSKILTGMDETGVDGIAVSSSDADVTIKDTYSVKTGSVKIVKKINGVSGSKVTPANIKITVTPKLNGSGGSDTFTLADISYLTSEYGSSNVTMTGSLNDAGGIVVDIKNIVPAGQVFTVKETVTPDTGIDHISVYYDVEGSSAVYNGSFKDPTVTQNGVKFDVNASGTSSIILTNNYVELDKPYIIIKKSFVCENDPLSDEDIEALKNLIEFKLINTDTGVETTINGTDIIGKPYPVETGKYTIQEIDTSTVDLIWKGVRGNFETNVYEHGSLTPVYHNVGSGGSNVEGYPDTTIDLTGLFGGHGEQIITNVYEKKKGKLSINKKVSIQIQTDDFIGDKDELRDLF